MEFHESDYVDDSFLEEIQCDKCPYSFPLYLFAEHELMVHGVENSDNSSSDSEDEKEEEVLNAQAEVKNPVHQSVEENVNTPTKEKDLENLLDENLVALAKFVSEQERTHKEERDKKVKVAFENVATDNFPVVEDIKLENEADALNLFSSKAKRVEEEKPSFQAPSNALLKGLYSKPHIRNDLTDSDNEDGESLEEFWRRADVKLTQRMRKKEEMEIGQKMY